MRASHTLIILASLSTTLFGSAYAQTPAETLTACDALASHPHDPDREAMGVTDDQMIPRKAIAACEAATSLNPNEPRAAFQLGRSYWLARRDADAFVYFKRAAEAGYAPAMKYIGDAYMEGRGLPQGQVRDPATAFEWYKKSGEGRFSDGLEMAEKANDKKLEQAKAAEKETFNPSIFQNQVLISFLYHGKNVMKDDVYIPGLTMYVASFVEEISGDKLLYVDSACRPLSRYAAEVIGPIGKEVGRIGGALGAIIDNSDPNASAAELLVGIFGGMFASGFKMEAFENEGKKDALILVNRYTCNSDVARKIMGNIVSFVNGGVDSIKSATGIRDGSEQNPKNYQPQRTSPTYSSPSPPAQAQNTTPVLTAFDRGSNDRRIWENWFNGLTGGYQQGAAYWAEKRSDSLKPTCFDPQGQSYGDFTNGCLAAKNLITPFDVNRRSDPEYKRGWNAY